MGGAGGSGGTGGSKGYGFGATYYPGSNGKNGQDLTHTIAASGMAGTQASGGGVEVGSTATATFIDTIVAQDTAQTGVDVYGSVVSNGHNFIQSSFGNIGFTTSKGDILNVNLNPDLAPLGNYGGPTQTMALLPGSPAIDAGVNTALAIQDFTGLQDWYQGQNNAQDSGPGGNNGTISGGVSYTAGVDNNAFNFNGQGSYIDLGTGADIVGTGAFCRGRLGQDHLHRLTGHHQPLRDANNYNGEYVLSVVNGKVNWYTFGNNEFGFNITSNQSIDDGSWHLVVAERLADGTGQVYIDGALDSSQAAAPVPLSSGFHVYIGEDVRSAVDLGSAYAGNFVGQIDEVQIYNTSLTPVELQSLYNDRTATSGGEQSITFPGLVSSYTGQGNSQDSTGLNNLTAVGGVSYAPGIVGQAFQLNGSTGYLVTAPNPSTLSITTANTVSAWVDPSVLKYDNVIIDKTQTGDAANYRFGIYGNQLFFWNGSQAVFSTGTISANTWTQVSFTLNALTNTLSFYINGQLDSMHTIGFGALNAAAVTIGRDIEGRSFQGLLDEVQIYNVALTPTQIGLLYNDRTTSNAGALPTTLPNLVSWYSAQGNSQDSTGLNNLTANGGVSYAPGVLGQAFQLNGSTGYLVTAPNPPSLSINTAITVSAWVDPSVLKNDNVIIDKTQTGDAANYRFGIHGNQLFFWNGSQAVFSVGTISTNTWTQVSFTLNASTNTLSFYINGKLDSTYSIGFGALNTAAVTIGRDIEGRSFQGLLDEVQIYNAALTRAQMALLYDEPNGVSTDQRGDPRPVGGAEDIGATEYQYDLAINGSAPPLVGAGNAIVYNVTITNNGPDTVSGATLTDVLPSSVTYQSLQAPSGWTATTPTVGQNGTVTLTDSASLAPGAFGCFRSDRSGQYRDGGEHHPEHGYGRTYHRRHVRGQQQRNALIHSAHHACEWCGYPRTAK